MATVGIGNRSAAAVLGALLLGIGLIAAGSGPPTVAIAAIDSVEEGAIVRVFGTVVHAWRYDSGLETMLLADLSDGSTVKLAHQSAASAAYTSTLRIGDEVASVGEVSHGDGGTTLWVTGADFQLVRESEAALTVEEICENWQLFEGDAMTIRGTIREGTLPGEWALADVDGHHWIVLFGPPLGLLLLKGSVVTLECELVLSTEELRFGLVVRSYAPT